MSRDRYPLNPFMSDLPLRDYLAMQLVLNELNSGKVMTDVEFNSMVHVSHMKAQQVIDQRFEYLKMELDNKIQELDQQEQYNFTEAQNAEAMKQFTPQKILQMQKEREEVEAWNRRNPHMPRRQYIPK